MFENLDSNLKNEIYYDINNKQTTPSVKQPDTLHSEVWLTSEEAAKLLKISTRTLITLRQQGLIPYSNPGGRMIRFLAKDLHNYLLAHYVRPRNWEGGNL